MTQSTEKKMLRSGQPLPLNCGAGNLGDKLPDMTLSQLR